MQTKETVVDFRWKRNNPNVISILGEVVEVIEDYSYLGVHCGCPQKWTKTSVLLEEASMSVSVCSKMLHIFHKSVLDRAICFASIWWGSSSIKASDSKKVEKLIKKAGSLLGTGLEQNVEKVAEHNG